MIPAFLDWASGPQSARDPNRDPNAFFGSHPLGSETRDELRERTGFTIEHLDAAVEKIQRSYRFLVPVLAASPQLIPIPEAVEAQDRRLGRLQTLIRLSLHGEDAFTTNGFEGEQRHLRSFQATLDLLDQPLEVLTADPRLGESLGTPATLGRITQL